MVISSLIIFIYHLRNNRHCRLLVTIPEQCQVNFFDTKSQDEVYHRFFLNHVLQRSEKGVGTNRQWIYIRITFPTERIAKYSISFIWFFFVSSVWGFINRNIYKTYYQIKKVGVIRVTLLLIITWHDQYQPLVYDNRGTTDINFRNEIWFRPFSDWYWSFQITHVSFFYIVYGS